MGSLFLLVKEVFDIVTSKVIRAPALFLPRCCHFNYLPTSNTTEHFYYSVISKYCTVCFIYTSPHFKDFATVAHIYIQNI